MRRALAADFACLEGARVVVTLDPRCRDEPGPWTHVAVGPGEEPETLTRLSAQADYTVLIAPETGGILADRARQVAEAGGRSLGATPDAIDRTADKWGFQHWLTERGIATPTGRLVRPPEGLPRAVPYPAVLKPVDGAGSIDTYFVSEAGSCPEPARALALALLQPWIEGTPMSASYLVGPDGRARLVGVGRQRVNVVAGRFVYRGGTIPAARATAAGDPRRAVESVPGLLGFVGVDYVWDGSARRAVVLEVNPRPTTSVVGLVRLLPAGALARAWLDVFEHRGGEELAGAVHAREPLDFEADGLIRPRGKRGVA